jgi:hypothetical protein
VSVWFSQIPDKVANREIATFEEPNRMREWSPSHGCLSGRKRPFRTRQFFAFRLAVAIKSQKRLEHDTIRTGETFITAKHAKGVMELVKKGIR